MGMTVTASMTNNYVNYAAMHCGIPIVDCVKLSGVEVERAILRITAVPEFLYEFKKEIVLEGKDFSLDKPELKLDDSFYRQELIEAREGEIKIEVLDTENPEKILGFCNVSIHIQPYLHWDACRHAGTMAAFMQPNDSFVARVLKGAGEYASKMGILMYGYQGKSQESVLKQAKCIYQALQDEVIHYISSPASFEDAGQKIRIPRQVLHEESKQGTCLDLAILYATCLEAASLNAGIVVISGHAFAGVWKEDGKTLPKYILYKEEVTQEVEVLIQNYFEPVECTTFTDARDISYEAAVEVGKKNIGSLRYMIDIYQSRACGIVPVYTYTDQPICEIQEETQEMEVDMAIAKEQLTKRERLQQQAMDLSVRNKLLSGQKDSFELQFAFDVENFMCGDIDEVSLFKETKQVLLDGGMKEGTFEECLYKLRASDREARRAKGKGNLYLALNELKWKTADGKLHRAVMYLVPTEIYLNKRGEYLFRLVQPIESFFNPVLKEKLIQDYKIDVSDMLDKPGTEYRAQMRQLGYLLEKKSGWSIEENKARLASFTIPNEAIWKGLSSERVLQHPIVNGLIKGVMDWEDEEVEIQEDLVSVYQADSSQSDIIQLAFQKKAQVVVGSAGNGKTQTIANIIADGIKQGKKTLLVSEKYSVLKVIQQMLEDLEIGMFTLSIMEGTHKVPEILKSIGETLRYLDTLEVYDWESSEDIKRYQKAGSEIRKYYEYMTKKGSCGKSMEELYNLYEKYRDCPVSLTWPEGEKISDTNEAENIIETLAEVFHYYDKTQGLYLEFLKYQGMDGTDKVNAQEAVDKVLLEGEKLRESAKTMAENLGISKSGSEKEWMSKTLEVSHYLSHCPLTGNNLNEMLDESVGSSEDEEIRTEILEYIDELREMEEEKTLMQRMKWNRIKREIRIDISDLAISKKSISRLKGISDLDELEYEIKHLKFEENNSNHKVQEAQEKYLRFIQKFEQGLSTLSLKDEEKKYLLELIQEVASGKSCQLKQDAQEFLEVYKQYSSAQEKAEELVVQNIKGFEEKYPDKLKLVLFEEWKKNINKNSDFSLYKDIKKDAEDVGIGTLVKQIEEEYNSGRLKSDEILTAYRKSWCEEQIRVIKDEFPELKEFNHIRHGLRVRHYRESERRIRSNMREELLYKQMERLPNIQKGAVNTPELGKLHKMLKKGKQISVRTLFEEAPHILSDLYPCMLMNPSAVAEYLPQDFPEFDLVIIDEGSQMPTYKALIPISYGKCCMIFGDEQQLTASTSFQRNLEEDGFMTPIESVLDDAIVASFPRKTLRYHYRSESESLIAFSNKKYYGNTVITFPSCNTKISGVSYEFVEDGCYDRGETKTNEKEALRVIEKVREIYAKLPKDTKDTVGIVTMNLNQKHLIQSLVMKEAANDIVFGTKMDELVSVSNLEACQGREWDYVILSPGYGPDKKGEFTTNMGPLVQTGGENRLNVMITRARKKMIVVTSLNPAMLKDAKSTGVNDFREFLSYAKGDIQYDTRDTGVQKKKNKHTTMIDRVASAIREHGYDVHTNIGSSECKVDIGIVSKKNDKCYVLGILTDHFKGTQRTIRDQEIIYPEALQRKGWNIYRLHSLSWYANPENEIDKIIRKIEDMEGDED